jgi:hypothetical protein
MVALGEASAPSRQRGWDSLTLAAAATLAVDDVLRRLQSSADGLSHDEASARLAQPVRTRCAATGRARWPC